MMRHVTVLLLWFIPATILAAPAEDHWGADPSEQFKDAALMVEREAFADALPLLQKLAEADPGDADVLNLLGFTFRKLGDLKHSGSAYARALRLNPDHLGALEYQGELFLALGEVQAAERNLARLAVLCPDDCAERTDLARAITASKAAD